ncbi:hypothetical protein VP01_7g10 [Puccinia sorghi]|uniref:Uncharacterized protein n=1 Tax=Puccinia sorghi TaxID=27349 RepID=A0A0L6UCN8_9BASI|nr:hypothetical protein VP01_7g10 [Puccinia sorghi]
MPSAAATAEACSYPPAYQDSTVNTVISSILFLFLPLSLIQILSAFVSLLSLSLFFSCFFLFLFLLIFFFFFFLSFQVSCFHGVEFEGCCGLCKLHLWSLMLVSTPINSHWKLTSAMNPWIKVVSDTPNCAPKCTRPAPLHPGAYFFLKKGEHAPCCEGMLGEPESVPSMTAWQVADDCSKKMTQSSIIFYFFTLSMPPTQNHSQVDNHEWIKPSKIHGPCWNGFMMSVQEGLRTTQVRNQSERKRNKEIEIENKHLVVRGLKGLRKENEVVVTRTKDQVDLEQRERRRNKEERNEK